MLPQALRAEIEERAGALDPAGLRRVAAAISQRYRSETGHGAHLLTLDSEAQAYALTRMPATYEAVTASLAWSLACTGARPRTLLDVGAGTGAATWAAAQQLSLAEITCLEREPAMQRLGNSLMSCDELLKQAAWISADLTKGTLPLRAELVTAAYVLGEMTREDRLIAANSLWDATEQLLLIVEPGTPAGWQQLTEIRTALLARGAHVAAPCPHHGPCCAAEGDWCAFTVRVQRSRLHRLLKEGDAPYEDEKFLYMAFTRERPMAAPARILRHPAVQKGQIGLTLCTPDGRQEQTIRKRDGDLFRAARKAECGDSFPPPTQEE